MSETRSIVKSVLGFLLAIMVIVGGMFGLGVDAEITDENAGTTPPEETVGDVVTDAPVEDVTNAPTEDVTDVPVDTDVPTEETNAPSTDSTPVEDETTDVETPVDTEVADTTEVETNATEGEVENA